jgi:hypothetical protein
MNIVYFYKGEYYELVKGVCIDCPMLKIGCLMYVGKHCNMIMLTCSTLSQLTDNETRIFKKINSIPANSRIIYKIESIPANSRIIYQS